ncbi:MAG TPA: 30S ribosomal protein S7, partial [Candidatus Brocadiales bacterium]|nr:30S ribosomal protein S7 [Candidatus Brocadiales bacterium]
MALEYRSTETFLKPDVVYGSKLVSKFINNLMKKGKKSLAEKTLYGALELVKKRLPDKGSLDVLETAVNNVKPLVEVRSRRIGGATYQVPIEVQRRRQLSLAFRWI